MISCDTFIVLHRLPAALSGLLVQGFAAIRRGRRVSRVQEVEVLVSGVGLRQISKCSAGVLQRYRSKCGCVGLRVGFRV